MNIKFYLLLGTITEERDPRRGNVYFLMDSDASADGYAWSSSILNAVRWDTRVFNPTNMQELAASRPGNNVLLKIDAPVVVQFSIEQLRELGVKFLH